MNKIDHIMTVEGG